jgi:transcriptional regulator with XRE-family HTH domain
MSTEKKMFASLPPSYLPELRREAWGRLFGLGIREIRKGAGLSIEQAAPLSGMEVSEWTAIEDGYVPQDQNRLRAMAAAMEIGFDQIAMLVMLCREAWEL